MSKAEQQLAQALSHIRYDEELQGREVGYLRRGKGWNHPPEKGLLVATNQRLYFSFYRKGVTVLSFLYGGISEIEAGIKASGQTLTFSYNGDRIYVTMIERNADLKEFMKLTARASDHPSGIGIPHAPQRALMEEDIHNAVHPAPRSAPISFSKLNNPAPMPSSGSPPAKSTEGDLTSKLKELAHLNAIGVITPEEYSTHKARLLGEYI